MEKAHLLQLLEKYRLGQCSAEEEALLHRWLDTVEQDAAGETSPLSDAERRHIRHDMLQQIMPAVRRPVYRRLRLLGRAAAIVLPLAFAGYLAARFGAARQAPPHNNGLAWHTLRNTSGRLQRQLLPDGSTVMLGPRSILAYPGKFGDAARKVRLTEGKAFFETVTDPARPFIVEAGGLQTTVLGTSFTVEASARLQLLRVAVATGKVKVDGKQAYGVLLPAQRLTVAVATGKAQRDSIATGDLLAWAREEIVLRNANLQELMLTLQQQYGVTPVTSLNVHEGNYTFRFPATMALPEALDIIQKISYKPKIHFSMKKDQLTIY